jgi:glycosyltransferase involved in cell wall biosynthesis
VYDNSNDNLQPFINKYKEEGYKPNVCFLLTYVPDPRINKRIKVFSEYGNVSVICVRRQNQDIYNPVFADLEYFIYNMDFPTSSNIFKRYKVSKKFQKKALNELKLIEPDMIYTDGLDTMLIAYKYSKYHRFKLFYEVADLRESYIEPPSNMINRIVVNFVKYVEKSCFSIVDSLIVCSPKFYDVYFEKFISNDKVAFIPNAPERGVFDEYNAKKEGKFTVGFIGGIRYLNQMKMLVDVAENINCNVLFAGAGGSSAIFDEILDYCKNKNWVSFYGKYDYKKDIAKLYGMVDCVYAVYDADNANVRIAVPNKMYESVICGLPIIVAKNTYLSEIVNKWGIGVAVGHKNSDDLSKALEKLSNDKLYYNSIVENCMKIKDMPAEELKA